MDRNIKTVIDNDAHPRKANGQIGRAQSSKTSRSLPCVIDMLYVKTPAMPIGLEAGGQTPMIIDHHSARRLMRCLKAAQKMTQKRAIDVTCSQKFSREDCRQLTIKYHVRVGMELNPDVERNYATFKLHIRHASTNKPETLVIVRLSRGGHLQSGHREVAIQGNPTSLLTGQNVWPLETITGDLRRDLALKLGWPCILVREVCRAVSLGRKLPKALSRIMLSGQGQLQNMQFAIYLDLSRELKQVALALLEAIYQTQHVGTQDGKPYQIKIGQLLRIKATAEYNKTGRSQAGAYGFQELATTLLQKTSGDHTMGSLSFYDKALHLRLSPGDAHNAGLADRLRLDITLQGRGLSVMLADAVRLARKHGVALDLVKDTRGQIAHCQSNVIEAISHIDFCFEAQIGGVQVRGFDAWLAQRMVIEEFHLPELLSLTREKWRALEQCFRNKGRDDRRYRKAFKSWQSVEGGLSGLRKCMIDAGLGESTADRQMKIVRALGFSGQVPPIYWHFRESGWLNFGGTVEDVIEVNSRMRSGKPVRRILKRNQAQLRPTLESLLSGVLALADQSRVPRVNTAAHIESRSRRLLPLPKAFVPDSRLRLFAHRALKHANAPSHRSIG